jgi:DNA-binding beta-propeller fold protein YncE
MFTSLVPAFKLANRAATPVIFASCFFTAGLHAQVTTPTPSPALLVTGSAGLSIVDPKNQQIVATIPTGASPHEIAVSPDGKLAMVSTFQGNTLSLIDLTEQKELDRYKFTFPTRVNGLAYADGKFVFTAEDADAIGRYDPAKKTVDAMVGLGQLTSHVLLYDAAIKTIIVTSRNSNSVTFVDTIPIEYRGNSRPNWRVTPVPAGITFNEAMDLSPDGKELWTAEFRGSHVAVLDIATKAVKTTFEVPDLHSDRLKFTPDGKRILLSDLENGQLRVIDVATHKEIQKLQIGKGLEGVGITPDGSTAYICSPSDNDVSIVDLKSLTVTGHISIKGALGVEWVP